MGAKELSQIIQQNEETMAIAKALMERIYVNLSDPTFTKADILRMIKTNVNCSTKYKLEVIFGKVTEEMIDEVHDANADEDDRINDLIMDNYQFKTLDIVKMNKSQKESFTKIPTMEEARFLEDIYYQAQSKRIIAENQLRSLNQGADDEIGDNEERHSSKNRSFLEWYLYNSRVMEDQVKNALQAFSNSNYLGRWATQVIGIGPVIATCLAANLRIEEKDGQSMTAGNWWSFCGLNDNLRPWISRNQAFEIIQNIDKQCQEIEGYDGIIDDEFVARLCIATGWRMPHYEKYGKKNGEWDRDKLIAATCRIPYNKKMKLLCFKIGQSFKWKYKNENSLYGRIYKERKQVETLRNQKKEYANQAYAILQKKNFNKSTTAYQYYSQGMLPPAHIDMRARRYAVKLFISHCFEAAYYNKYGKMAPNPYVIQYMGHKDYIPPEVPYESVDRD